MRRFEETFIFCEVGCRHTDRYIDGWVQKRTTWDLWRYMSEWLLHRRFLS